MTEVVISEGKRPGRGFSRGEVSQAGLTDSQARGLGLRVDTRRRSVHPPNVEALKKSAKDLPVKPKKAKKPKAAKPAAKAAPKAKETKVAKPKTKDVALKDIQGLGPKRAEQLNSAGIKKANDLIGKDPAKLSKSSGIPETTLEKYIEEAKKLAG